MIQLVDDQRLGAILRREVSLDPDTEVFTTGFWYVRLCQAVLATAAQPGKLSGPFVDLPDETRSRAIDSLLVLPDNIGLVSLRVLGPLIGRLRARYQLNILAMEALAAATHLDAHVYLSSTSPKLESALAAEDLVATVL